MSVPAKTLAQMIRNSAAALGKATGALGEQFTWSPLGKGRSAHDQLIEVALLYLFGKHIVEMGEVPELDWSIHTTHMQDYDTLIKTVNYLNDSADLLATAVEVASDERLATVVTLPFGGGMDKTIAEVIMMAYWNTVYHEGQVNYIHTLCEA